MSIHLKVIRVIAMTVIITCLITGWFYWFQWRPTQIRKKCSEEIIAQGKQEKWTVDKTNWRFGICLTQNGLKTEKLMME